MTNEKDLLYGTTVGVLPSVIVLILMILLCLVIMWYRSRQNKVSCHVMFNLVFYHHNYFIVEHAVKAHKVVGLETSPAKETVSNPHYRNIAYLYIDNNPQCESRKTKQLLLLVQTAIQNSMKMRKIMLYLLLTLYQWKLKIKRTRFY